MSLSFGELLEKAGFSNYEDYLKGKHWKALRRRFLRGQSCRACDSKLRVLPHHITYERLGNERDGDLLPLCFDCHERLHAFLDEHFPQETVIYKALRTAEVFQAVFGRLVIAFVKHKKKRGRKPKADKKPTKVRTPEQLAARQAKKRRKAQLKAVLRLCGEQNRCKSTEAKLSAGRQKLQNGYLNGRKGLSPFSGNLPQPPVSPVEGGSREPATSGQQPATPLATAI